MCAAQSATLSQSHTIERPTRASGGGKSGRRRHNRIASRLTPSRRPASAPETSSVDTDDSLTYRTLAGHYVKADSACNPNRRPLNTWRLPAPRRVGCAWQRGRLLGRAINIVPGRSVMRSMWAGCRRPDHIPVRPRGGPFPRTLLKRGYGHGYLGWCCLRWHRSRRLRHPHVGSLEDRSDLGGGE